MRLTLRTLLAWKDGVLPPEERNSLGEKVEASQVARHLVERIRTVVGNAQLSSARIGAKGLVADANSVAEYLDNVLPAERLEAFETICLESDMHLAEVSACHEILAEVARDPAVIAPLDEPRRRALLESIEHRIQSRTGIVLGGAASVSAPSTNAGAVGTARTTGRRGDTAAPHVAAPAGGTERGRVPWGAWALLGSALLLLVALGLFFAQTAGLLRTPGTSRPPIAAAKAGAAAADAAIEGPAAEPAVEPVAEPIAAADDDADAAAGAVAEAAPRNADAPRGLAELLARADAEEAAGREGDPAAARDAVVPEDTDGDVAATVDAGEGSADAAAVAAVPTAGVAEPPNQGPRKVRAGDALAIAAGARPVRPPRDSPMPRADGLDGAAPDIGKAVGLEARAGIDAIGFVAADGAVLRRVADGDIVTWEPLAVGGGIADGTLLVVPPGMRPEINLAGMSVRIEPRSIVRLVVDEDGVPGVEPILGRVVVRAASADARLALRCGAIDGRATAGLDGSVAAEVASVPMPDAADGAAETRAVVYAIGKPVRWTKRDAAGGPDAIPARGGLRWSSADPGRVELIEATGRLPDWATGRERLDPLERGAAEAFVARLETLPEGSPPAAGLGQVLASMAIDRRVENRVFAAITFALVGDYDVALELLCADDAGRKLEGRQWKALEAAVVPMALARGPESAERLRRAWEDRGPPGRGELLMQLARRPTDADLAAGFDRTLVEALSDGALVVRRFASGCLVEIVRPSPFDAARYRPDASENLRREGVSWWRVQQEKGLVRRAGP